MCYAYYRFLVLYDVIFSPTDRTRSSSVWRGLLQRLLQHLHFYLIIQDTSITIIHHLATRTLVMFMWWSIFSRACIWGQIPFLHLVLFTVYFKAYYGSIASSQGLLHRCFLRLSLPAGKRLRCGWSRSTCSFSISYIALWEFMTDFDLVMSIRRNSVEMFLAPWRQKVLISQR